MPKKHKFKRSSSGDKQSVKETSGITQSHNWASSELGFGENTDIRYRDIQSSRHEILPAKVLFPHFALTSVRKESFETWQRIIQAQSEKLAETGFIYSGIAEDVKFQPYQLGILPVEKAFPDYAVVSTRKDSFKTWPKYIPVKPKDLAEAGFFYGGIGDNVKCYYCGGGLRYWEPGDEPWTEHAKWYPSCPHLVLNKGTEFIEEIKNIGVVSKPKESDLMDSPAVAAVREFVDEETVVRQAVEYAIKFNDSKNIRTITAQDLMKIVENIREGKASIPVGDETREHAETILKLAPGSIRKPTTGVEGNKEDMEKIQVEKERLDEQRLCKICLKARACVMFLPCRHCISCPQCVPALKKCPELFCMKKIKGLVRIVL